MEGKHPLYFYLFCLIRSKIVVLAAFFILMLKLFGHTAAQREQSPDCATLFWVYSTFSSTLFTKFRAYLWEKVTISEIFLWSC